MVLFFSKKEPPAKKTFSILGFSGLQESFVLHDFALDDSIFRESQASTESKKLVGGWLFGIQLRWNRFDLGLSNTLRSDEFKGQQKNNRFGSAILH